MPYVEQVFGTVTILRRIAPLVALAACLVCNLPFAAETLDDDEIELERVVELEVQLLRVESVPGLESTRIARFRIVAGPYRGAMLSLSYDFTFPVRLRSWDVHDQAGYRRLGGAKVNEPAMGQWDAMLEPGSTDPRGTLSLWLVQRDLNEDEEDRRWHFTRLESIVAPDRDEPYEIVGGHGDERPPFNAR